MTITQLSISNLRGIRAGTIAGLSSLSILVGPNNSGKSTVLEALVCAALGNKEPKRLWEILLRRGGPLHHSLQTLFPEKTSKVALGIEGVTPQESRSLSLRRVDPIDLPRAQQAQVDVSEKKLKQLFADDRYLQSFVHVGAEGFLSAPLVSGSFGKETQGVGFVDVEAVRTHGALEEFYSAIEATGQRNAVLEALRVSFRTLEDLRILKAEDEFVLHTVSSDGAPPVPAYLAGDGFKRLLSVAATLAANRGALVVLEEPECFQHPRYLEKLVAMLHHAAAAGTQIVLSTHSLELLDALLSGPEGLDLRGGPTVHRLRRVNGVLHAKTVSVEEARVLRQELLEDLRS